MTAPAARQTAAGALFSRLPGAILHFCKVSEIKEIHRKTPLPERKVRAAKGAWVQPAWAVRRLLEKQGGTVSDAVRKTVEVFDLKPRAAAFRGVRVAYYLIRDKPLPEES